LKASSSYEKNDGERFGGERFDAWRCALHHDDRSFGGE